jgi:hypothetical protein
LDDLVDEFLAWLSDGENPFQNKEKFEEYITQSK